MDRLLHHIGFSARLVLGRAARHALDHHVATELAGEHHQRALQQAARFQIENQLGDGPVDLLFHPRVGGVAVFVRVPMQERHVFRRHFDKARSSLGQTPRQQTAQAKAAGIVLFVDLFRFLGDVESIAFF